MNKTELVEKIAAGAGIFSTNSVLFIIKKGF